MMMTVIHHQHQMSADGRDGAHLVAACRPQAPAVVHYDTRASHHGFSLPVEMTHTSLKTGPAIVPGTFPILTRLRVLLPRRAARPVQWPSLYCIGRPILLEPLSNHAVSLLGAGVMDSIRHPRCNSLPLLRRGSRLRKQPAKFIFRRISHDLQNLSDALHTHVYALSRLNFRAPIHGRSSEGWRYQKTIMRCPK